MLEQSLRPTLWPTLGYGVKCPMGASSRPLLPETQALLSRMTVQPDTARKVLIDKTIRSLKADGIWPLLGFLHIMAAHDVQAAQLNWLGSSKFNLVRINSPLFEVDRGFTGDGVGASLNISGSALATGKISLESASLGVFAKPGVRTYEIASGWRFSIYCSSTSGPNVRIHTPEIYQGSNFDGPFPGKYFAASRNLPTQIDTYKDGSHRVVNNAPVTSLGGNEQFAYLRIGGVSFSDSTVLAGYVGAYMTPAQHAALYTTLNNYMQEVGNV